MNRVNDVAFILNQKIVVLVEHQSTICGNMPLRLYVYSARIYELIVENKSIYAEDTIKIPRPEFIVLYNDPDDFPEEKTLKLSDAYESSDIAGTGSFLDLSVRIVNINKGYNAEMIAGSLCLRDYVEFIAKVRENINQGMSLTDAITNAVEDCIAQGILVDLLQKNSKEVINMLTAEFDLEAAKHTWQKEASKKATVNAKINDAIAVIKGFRLPLKSVMEQIGLSNDYRGQIVKKLTEQNVEFTDQ